MRNLLRTRTLLGLLVLGLSLGVAAPALAHHKPGHTGGPGSNCPNPGGRYPPGQCNPAKAAVTDSTTTRGQQIRWFAQGYRPGSPVTLTFFSTPVPMGTAQADSSTFVERLVRIPADADLGSHRIVSTGIGANGSPLTLTVPLTVSADGAGVVGTPSGSGGGDLPRTGVDVALAALVGAGLIAVGTTAVVAGRRRRHALPA